MWTDRRKEKGRTVLSTMRRRRRGRRRRRNNCDCDFNDDTLTIFNSNGRVVARINGNNITCIDNNDNNSCGCGCNNSGVSLVSDNGNIALSEGNLSTTSDSNCGCGRNNRYRRY